MPSGMRISFKELLLLKGIVDSDSTFKDEQGVEWVWDISADRYLSKGSLPQALSRAVDNGIVDKDVNPHGTLIKLSKLGKKILKAAEPEYAKKIAEAADSERESFLAKQKILRASAQHMDLAEFDKAFQKTFGLIAQLSTDPRTMHRLMKEIKRGKLVMTDLSDNQGRSKQERRFGYTWDTFADGDNMVVYTTSKAYPEID